MLVIVREAPTRVPFLVTFVKSGGWAEDIVKSKFDVASAWRTVVMMQVIIGAHYHRLRGGQADKKDQRTEHLGNHRWHAAGISVLLLQDVACKMSTRVLQIGVEVVFKIRDEYLKYLCTLGCHLQKMQDPGWV